MRRTILRGVLRGIARVYVAVTDRDHAEEEERERIDFTRVVEEAEPAGESAGPARRRRSSTTPVEAAPPAKRERKTGATPAALRKQRRPIEAPREGAKPVRAGEKSESTPGPAFREPILQALADIGHPATRSELYSRLEDAVELKPGDRKRFPNGLERWQFMVTRELGTLAREGRATKEGDLWRIPGNA